MKTFMANPAKIDRKWYVVDAEGKTLGRLASEVAKVQARSWIRRFIIIIPTMLAV